VAAVYIGEDDFTPVDLDTTKQGYMMSQSSRPDGIDAALAWDYTFGSPAETLAIIEQGFGSSHFEFAGRLAGHSSVDLTTVFDGPAGNRWHGTSVASVLIANQNDSGMVGVNWNSSLYAVRHNGGSNSWGTAIDLADAAGARYMNMSFGFYPTVNPCTHNEPALAEKSNNAWVKGRIMVASKGNRNVDWFHLPSDILTLIGVGSINTLGQKHTHAFSQGIKVSAPGQFVYVADTTGGFATVGGTSYASPLTAGGFSLVGAANLNLLADEIEQLVYQTTTDVDPVGYDDATGWGIVNVGAAVSAASSKVGILRDSIQVTSRVQLDSSASKYTFGCFVGNLPTGQYTDVVEYKCYDDIPFPVDFGHMPSVLIRTRSVDGWPLTTESPEFSWAADTIVQFPWARSSNVDTSTNTFRVETGAYWISPNATNDSGLAGWWPCDSPPCSSFAAGPDIDIEYTLLYCTAPGDANNDCSVNIADVTYMIARLFSGGPDFPIRNDADVDADPLSSCKFNIVDITYLMASILSGGPAPIDNNCTPGSLKETAGEESFVFAEDVTLDVGASVMGKRVVKYNSSRKVNALAIRLRALNGSKIDVTKTSAKSNLYWSQDGSDVIIGLIDPQGEDFFLPSDSDLVAISGDFEIVSVEATDIHADGTTEYLRPQFVAGKFTAGGAPGIGEFSLDGAFPNPFNPVTQIAFSLPVASDVTIEIYNVLGQRVITLTDSYFEAGKHTVRWSSQSESGSTVASGMYFAKMTAGDFSASKKLVILK
jgi:Subtilase family/Secretion system C-terminal sorting domain